MLFNSFEFIGVYLPVVLAGFYLICRMNRTDLAIYFLACASVVFYGWWSWKLVWLLVGSVLVNYLFGRVLVRRPLKAVLALGGGFMRGDRVRIIDGPLSDLEGLFDCHSDEERVTVLLELMGRKVKVRMPLETVCACA